MAMPPGAVSATSNDERAPLPKSTTARISGGAGVKARLSTVKVTTVAVLLALVRASARGGPVLLFGQPVREESVRQAASVLAVALLVLAVALFLLALSEDIAFDRLLFEALSALGTVGLSLGATAELTEAGKLVVAALMAIGRIGVLGFAVALAAQLRQPAAERAEPADIAL